MKNEKKPQAATLRIRAEELLNASPSKGGRQFIDADTIKLIHELDVYHIELEMQNEELRIAKQEAELAAKKYTELYDNAPAGYFTLSKDGDIIDLNLYAAEMLGKERKRLINNRFGLFISDHTRPVFNLFFDRIFTLKAKEYCDLVLTTADKLSVHVHLTGTLAPDTEQCLITAVDITALMQNEEKLKKYTSELEVSNRELENFAFVASHDLQEPLRMVIGFLNLLEKRMRAELNDTAKEYIHFAVDGANRMKELINELLEYSRAGFNKEKFTDTDLNEVLGYINKVLKNVITQKMAIVNILQLPVVKVNKTLITELFLNLINNALKFSGTNDPVIEVGYTEEKDKYLFYVKDNGIGISPENFEKIFGLFQRLHGKTEYAGAGIGLALCKKIVELHKGKIWLESEVGKGSTFYFTLPHNH